MRHGVQAITSDIAALPAVEQKIRLMQPPHNTDDPITLASGVEAIGTGLALAWAAQLARKDVVVLTTANARGRQVATVFGSILGVPVYPDKRLDCIDYRTDISAEAISEILGKDKAGKLVWGEAKVDGVTREGTYQRITQDMRGLIGSALDQNHIVIAITHTQQLNAVAVDTGMPATLDTLGMQGYSARGSLLLPNGVVLPR